MSGYGRVPKESPTATLEVLVEYPEVAFGSPAVMPARPSPLKYWLSFSEVRARFDLRDEEAHHIGVVARASSHPLQITAIEVVIQPCKLNVDHLKMNDSDIDVL